MKNEPNQNLTEVNGLILIRPLSATDDMAALTGLIHAAYSKHAAKDLRYWATHQTPEDTAKRFALGHGLIAELNGAIVGTITVRPPQPESPIELFRDPDTWTLFQFAVSPQFQGMGIGSRLHQAALTYAAAHGGRVIALDTAAPATDLIEFYRRWGYQVVGECDWRPRTNYPSVILSRPIAETKTLDKES
ncbi:MAG: GNAT family N-acetyltransferase [Methylacidiphilales bacterium]|nr:GNAT family N-acetyltransferase [Candidatus Methylacidiphilales bacterium]